MHLNPDPFDLIDTHGGAITRAFMLIYHGSQKCRFLVASDSFHLFYRSCFESSSNQQGWRFSSNFSLLCMIVKRTGDLSWVSISLGTYRLNIKVIISHLSWQAWAECGTTKIPEGSPFRSCWRETGPWLSGRFRCHSMLHACSQFPLLALLHALSLRERGIKGYNFLCQSNRLVSLTRTQL